MVLRMPIGGRGIGTNVPEVEGVFLVSLSPPTCSPAPTDGFRETRTKYT